MAGYIGNKAVGINVTTGDILGDVGVGGNIDVDGISNLDVVDIDGAVNMASTLETSGVVTVKHTDGVANVSLSPTSTGGVINVRNSSGVGVITLDGRNGLATIGNKLILTDGNLVVAAGHGIDFSAQTQSPNYTAQSEILDHYEEGAWSPTWVAASGTIAANGTHTSGKYTRIGRVVYIEGYISYQSNSSASGAISIAGLPFTAVTTGFGQSNNQAGGVSSFANALWSSNAPNAGRIPANTATIIPTITTATGGTITQFSDFNTGSANYSQFVFFGHYLVNQ